MTAFDLIGADWTLLALAALAAGGYLLALRLLGPRAAADPLELAVAALLAATAEGVGLGLALGAAGILRIGVALPLALAAAGALYLLPRRLSRTEMAAPLRAAGDRLRARCRPGAAVETGAEAGAGTSAESRGAAAALVAALAILTVHGIGSEALRGLLRPPLSWDSLMYHLQLTATWLQSGNLAPVFGAYPMNYYGYAPANGSVWLWWWMAPSHSELYANLAFLPQWALLGLASGLLARALGARRSWPLAAFLVTMTPTVLRFAATQYVDVFTAACLVAALCFALRWAREPRWSDAVLAGMGLGVGAGAKVLGLGYAGGIALAAVLLARGGWRRRVPQLAAVALLAAALGGFFYLRNAVRGVGPLALQCEGVPHDPPKKPLPPLPRPNSIADLPGVMLGRGQLFDAFVGTAAPGRVFTDLGVGPQCLLLLLAAVALPFASSSQRRPRRREAWIAGASLLAILAIWTTVPYSASGHVYANIRYLDAAIAIAFAGGLAVAEALGASVLSLGALAVALVAQDLLQLHAEMPFGVRAAVAAADLAAVALALSPGLRRGIVRFSRPLAVAAALALVLMAPLLGSFRSADRGRALGEEYTAHATSGRRFAAGWTWLDENAGDGTVDVVSSPDTFFVYPAMGPRLERRAIYVNVNRQDLHEAAAYPRCQPRVDPSADAWLANLRREGVRWLYLSRNPPYPFPMEDGWAQARRGRFALRFADVTNRVWEVLPESGPASGSASGAADEESPQ